jgi:hypothetical protein
MRLGQMGRRNSDHPLALKLLIAKTLQHSIRIAVKIENRAKLPLEKKPFECDFGTLVYGRRLVVSQGSKSSNNA